MRINFNRIIKGWPIAVAMMSFLFSQAPASAQKLSYGAAESFVEVHGFVDLKYQDFEADGERKGVSTFDNNNFNIFFKSEIRENLSVIGEVEYEHGGEEFELDRAEFILKLSEAALKILQDKKIIYYLEPVIRFDTINPNDNITDNSDRSRITLGLNYSPYPHYLLKTEYQLIREDNGKNLSNDGLQLVVVADF